MYVKAVRQLEGSVAPYYPSSCQIKFGIRRQKRQDKQSLFHLSIEKETAFPTTPYPVSVLP